jgi:hypothetical protein
LSTGVHRGVPLHELVIPHAFIKEKYLNYGG